MPTPSHRRAFILNFSRRRARLVPAAITTSTLAILSRIAQCINFRNRLHDLPSLQCLLHAMTDKTGPKHRIDCFSHCQCVRLTLFSAAS